MDPAKYPGRAARQWIAPSIPPERLASGSRQVSRQRGLPVDPAEYAARAVSRQSSRRVSRQSSSPVDPAEYPGRAARQWIAPSIPPERLASGSRQVSRQRVCCQSSWPVVDPAQYPARVDGQRVPPSIPPEQPASGSRQVSR